MPLLNANKQLLLNQIKRQPTIELQKLLELLKTYEDLKIEDFKGYISEVLYTQLTEAGRDPHETQLWDDISNAPHNTPEEIQALQRLVMSYLQKYPQAPKVKEAQTLVNKLQVEMNEALAEQGRRQAEEKEKRDWDTLDRGNYNALLNYKMRYPNSVHLDELDDLMWINTKNALSTTTLNRYLSDWPEGRYASEARSAINSYAEWDKIKHQPYVERIDKLFAVDDFRDNHPDATFINEVNALYYQLREEELERMKQNPSEYGKDIVLRLIDANIFTDWQLKDEGLMTDESWTVLTELERDLFPNIQEYQIEDPNIRAIGGCTDIYLFGTPGTGKTCLLMGLTGANGQGYSLNMKAQGGPYASALQQYVNAGITPGRTFGKFVTTINGQINEETKRGNVLTHRINFVEMSGEEFALRIADGKEVQLANMGTGATNLLKNQNRKVFFIIVDSTKEKVKVEYVEQVKDAEGNVIDERIRKRYISQLDILNKFVSLFELPENQEIMSRVDAIHFVVTKADMLGDKQARREKARNLLLSIYGGPIEQLKNYCRQTKRINYSTGYRPFAFTFSLGQFYLGDIFSFDSSETLQIINTIRTITGGTKEKTWWDRFKEAIN